MLQTFSYNSIKKNKLEHIGQLLFHTHQVKQKCRGENMQNVYVRLKRDGEHKVPKFSECILDYFAKDLNTVRTSFSLEGNVFSLAPDEMGCKLQHSPECPIKVISEDMSKIKADEIKPEKKSLNIGVAVSMLIESSNNYVLLTRRAPHMRSSPGVWVPPGGHLDLGETLLEGGYREVEEETGLKVVSGEANVLCLWENVYPLLLGLGSPQSHLLIVYFHVKMKETHDELHRKVKFESEEVDSYCWLHANTILQLFESKKLDKMEKQYAVEDGIVTEKDLDPNIMFNRYLWSKREPYSGTQCCLKNWLEIIKSSQQGPLSKF